MKTRRVVVYRNELLPPTETFILSQAGALQNFNPTFAGLKRVSDGLDLAAHPVITLCGPDSWYEKTRRRIFLRSGQSRQFIHATAMQSPEVIHAHFAIDACAVLPIARELRIPLVVTLHGYDVSCREESLTRWATARAYLRRKEKLWQYATAFICVSDHVRERALSLGYPTEKLWKHHIGIKPRARSKQEWDRRQKIVLFVGRLVEKKGCIHLIRAMARIRRAVPEVRLVIVGDGPLRQSLETEAASCAINVVFVGHQSHFAVQQWMQRASVLAAPSVEGSDGDSEGLPTVLCEAQAAGLPAVAFAIDGVTEAFPVERRKTLPVVGDIAALADEIIRLLEDDGGWHEASNAGLKYVEKHFDINTQTRLMEKKYEEVIARHRA
jgi:glycosyltransferase involved in cell wall biosynthesis